MTNLLSVSDSLTNILFGLKDLNIATTLSEFGDKFRTLSNIDVPSSLSFSDLMGKINENTTTLGTILNSEGTPTAVIFNMKQYKKVNAIVEFIPSVIESLTALSKKYIKLQKLGSKMLEDSVPLLISTVAFTAIGTFTLTWGAYKFGQKYERTSKKDINAPKTTYWKEALSLTFGLSAIALSMFITIKASQLNYELGKALTAQ